MEQARRFYGGAALGERNLEWDLNNWKWDGDLFIARQLDPASVPSNFNGQSSNTSSSCSEPEIQKGNLDRKRRAIVVDDEEDDDEGGTLSLKLGQSQLDGTIGKRTKFGGGGGGFLNRAACQVEGCCADLSIAKDYHRRHKVCEMHSKVSKALVGNVMQRFCQQCSRFHLLQEFDEGKRSCRRRLAGHNKRRRKTQPETLMSGQPAGGEQASNYILISLLRLLSNMQSNNRSDSNTDQDLVARLLRSLVSQSGSNGFGAINEGNMGRISALPSGTPPRPPKPTSTHLGQPALAVPHKPMQAASSEKSDGVFLKDSPPTSSEVRDSVVTTTKLNSFDLNNIYIDSDDSQHSSPPQVSGNSDSASAPSPSSSAGEAQGRTDRIVFKLFGKEPSDFPMVLRGQILDWLAHSPTDIESYIRPGCVILTIYLRLAEPIWEELSSDLGSSLSRLLDITEEPFWRSGWVYTRVENRIVFCYNGRIVIDKSLPSQDSCCSRILSVTPIAVSISERARFQITGYNLSNPSTRFLCALEGEYLALEPHQDSTTDNSIECLDLSCSIPSVTGRGFIEVEDEGLSSGFFPFIVAESDVCSEIRMLESILESTDSQELSRKWEARQQAMDFIHEMGWLLHRCQSKSRLGHQNPNTEPFSLTRFRQLMEFSMDHDWCAVVKKLLDILVEGSVSHGEHPSLDAALSEMRLLHRAVRRNCRALVDLLLRYIPVSSSKDSGEKLLFRPDVKGPAGLTPLHIAAGRDFSEAVLDALTDDPGKVGIEAWKSARDSTGATPEDYARLRGHYTYIRMVERKISRRSSTGCVVINIPEDTSTRGSSNRLGIGVSSLEITTVLSRSLGRSCKGCENKIAYGVAGRSRAYRPAMLSMVAIAAVCVCVALFFKTSPVVYLFRPFCWESLHFGSI